MATTNISSKARAPIGHMGVPTISGDGTPYTPDLHRLFFQHDPKQLPMRLINMGFNDKHRFPTANFKQRDGKRLGMMFTKESQAVDPMFAALAKTARAKLLKHVRETLEERRIRADWLSVHQTREIGAVEIPDSFCAGPKSYAMTAEGDCLAPQFQDGDIIVCDPDQVPTPGN